MKIKKDYKMAQSKSINKDLTKLTVFEQFNILNNQMECLYGLIANTHKFYSVLSSSIVGVAILLYSNNILPTNHFNYLYYIIILMYAVSIIWYRNLAVYWFDLNNKSAEYNEFIKKNKIISMYNSSVLVNTRKVNMVIPFLLGGIICLTLIKYSTYISWYDYLFSGLYILLFYLGFLRKISWQIIKSL